MKRYENSFSATITSKDLLQQNFALDYLRSVTSLAASFLQDKSRSAPDPLLETVLFLHDILWEMYKCDVPWWNSSTTLHNEISLLCELWWKQDRPGKESLVPVTAPYLIARALEPTARLTNLKRLYAFKQALLVLDYEDER